MADDARAEMDRFFADRDNPFLSAPQRPRRSLQQLIDNIGVSGVLRAALPVGLFLSILIARNALFKPWWVLPAFITVGAVLPWILAGAMLRRGFGVLRWPRWIHWTGVVLFLGSIAAAIGRVPGAAIIGGRAGLALMVFAMGLSLWLLADHRVNTPRGIKAMVSRAARVSVRSKPDPDDSVYRSLR